MRVDELGLFVGQRDFGAAHIQLPDHARAQSFLLRLHFFLQHADRLFVHANLGAIQQQLVKSDPHVHFHAVGERLQLQFRDLGFQPRDRELARDRAAGVEILHDTERRIVIFIAQTRIGLMLAFAQQPGRHDRRQIAGTRFDQTAVRRLYFFRAIAMSGFCPCASATA